MKIFDDIKRKNRLEERILEIKEQIAEIDEEQNIAKRVKIHRIKPLRNEMGTLEKERQFILDNWNSLSWKIGLLVLGSVLTLAIEYILKVI